MVPVPFSAAEIPGSLGWYHRDPEIAVMHSKIMIVVGSASRACLLMSAAHARSGRHSAKGWNGKAIFLLHAPSARTSGRSQPPSQGWPPSCSFSFPPLSVTTGRSDRSGGRKQELPLTPLAWVALLRPALNWTQESRSRVVCHVTAVPDGRVLWTWPPEGKRSGWSRPGPRLLQSPL